MNLTQCLKAWLPVCLFLIFLSPGSAHSVPALPVAALQADRMTLFGQVLFCTSQVGFFQTVEALIPSSDTVEESGLL